MIGVDSAGRVYRIVGVIDSMSAGGYLTADLLFSEHDRDAEPEPKKRLVKRWRNIRVMFAK